jgi:hypothetical protein
LDLTAYDFASAALDSESDAEDSGRDVAEREPRFVEPVGCQLQPNARQRPSLKPEGPPHEKPPHASGKHTPE